jgi:SET domain-containing protein
VTRGPRLVIKRAGEKGMGVFAAEDIPAGTVVVRYSGRPRCIWEIPRDRWERCFQVDYDVYVLPRRGTAGWYINHSCEPNCVVRGEREVVTARPVRRGEELTFDYSTNVGWEEYEMRCSCGSEKCRKVVRSYAYLPEAWKRRYGGNVSPFLLRKEGNR